MKTHFVVEHGARHDVDILVLLQHLTVTEKVDLKEKLTERRSKNNLSYKIAFWNQMEGENPKQD